MSRGELHVGHTSLATAFGSPCAITAGRLHGPFKGRNIA
jgi:hypothetical protein